jgi:hypothetical protein
MTTAAAWKCGWLKSIPLKRLYFPTFLAVRKVFLVAYFPLCNPFVDNQMTIIGETYQVNGTLQHAYCRSNKLIPESLFYNGVVPGLSCIEEENVIQFLSATSTAKGLDRSKPAVPPSKFMCEEP